MAMKKVTSRRSKGQPPTPNKASPKQAKAEETVSNGPGPAAKARSQSKSGTMSPRDQDTPFNAETAQVLRDADAGTNLLEYPSLEAMFEDRGI